MDKRIKGGLQILAALLIVVGAFLLSQNSEQFQEWGYVGVFIISVLSAATLFIPAPGWAVVIAMGRVLDTTLVGLVAGMGSAMGELTGYFAGKGAREAVNTHYQVKKYRAWIRKYDFATVLILAFIPNPFFDVAGLIAGGLGVPWWRYLLATAIGRTVRYILLAQLGAFSLNYI